MANALKCDMCGAFYTENKVNTVKHNYNKDKNYLKIQISLCFKQNDDDEYRSSIPYSKSVDLCDKCRKEILNKTGWCIND